MDPGRFSGQIAIITGGATGIGRAIAERMAKEGATLVLWDINRNAIDTAINEFSTLGITITGDVVDVGDANAVAEATLRLAKAHGRLDIAIHCAGIVGPALTPITDISVEDFDRVIKTNLRSSFLITKHAIKIMQQRNYGRILLFASIAGKEGNPGMCPYSVSKAGVIGLAKAVGKEFAESGITVNAIAPGVIRTKMVAELDPRQVTYMTDKIPMKRTGTLDEIAAISSWIVSKEASFNTGFTFDMSGGRATY
jgi:NAD(P)-dependent dehydrogenase (short-subunit alcohol dehydrogenase family)